MSAAVGTVSSASDATAGNLPRTQAGSAAAGLRLAAAAVIANLATRTKAAVLITNAILISENIAGANLSDVSA